MIARIHRWKDLERWLPGASHDLSVAHPLVPLREIMTNRRTPVPRERFSDYQPITIHLDGRISARIRHEAFKGTMFAAFPGDLVYSKIDVRNGAITLIPDTIPQAVVTPEYPVMMPDVGQVDARYLALLLRSPEFKSRIKGAATGHSGRKRVHGDSFGDIEVPLPELSEQRSLLAAYESDMAEAARLEREAAEIENAARRRFESELGLTPPADLPKRPFLISRFRDLDRWSHEGILDRARLKEAGLATERFPLVSLGDVVADLENGWSPQCLDRPAKPNEWGVLKLGAVSFGEFDASENKALPTSLKPAPELEVKTGDILISRANILRLVGAVAHVRETRPRLMLCDKIFRIIPMKDSPILPEFLAEILKAPSVRQQIEANATGTSPTMKNISKPALLELTFPLPSGPGGLTIQSALVELLAAARNEAASMRVKAAARSARAQENFLTAVFG